MARPRPAVDVLGVVAVLVGGSAVAGEEEAAVGPAGAEEVPSALSLVQGETCCAPSSQVQRK